MTVGESFFVRAKVCSAPGCAALVAFIFERAGRGASGWGDERAWAECSACGELNELVDAPRIAPVQPAAWAV